MATGSARPGWLVSLAVAITLFNVAYVGLRRPPGPAPRGASAVYRIGGVFPPAGTRGRFLAALAVGLAVLVAASAASSRLSRPGRTAAFLALTLAIWGGMEHALWTYVDRHPTVYVPDADLIWRIAPHGRLEMPDSFATCNTWGLRGPDFAVPRPAGTFRILVLGDSALFGFGVDDADTFPAALERLLRARMPGRKVEVVNAAVPGYSTLQGLRWLQLHGAALGYDWLVVGFNDDAEVDPIPDRERVSWGAAGWMRRQLYRSCVYLLLRQAALEADRDRIVRAEQRALAQYADQQPRRVPIPDLLANLRAMHALARQEGAGVTLLILPRNPALGVRFSWGYEAALERAARQERMPLVDAYQRWRAPSDAGCFLPGDALHLDRTGLARLAALTAPTIERSGR